MRSKMCYCIMERFVKMFKHYEHCRYRGVDGVVIACINFFTEEVQRLVQSTIRYPGGYDRSCIRWKNCCCFQQHSGNGRSCLLYSETGHRKITLPLLRPILIYVMITSLIGGMQMFDVPQILTNGTGDPMRSTMTLIMYLNKHLFSKNYGAGGALSVFLFVVTGILSFIVFKMSTDKKD